MAFEAKANSGNKPGWVKYVNPVFYGKGIGKFFIRRGKFIKESGREFKKVTWPDKERVLKATGVVLSSVALITLFIWLVDSGFNQGLNLFFKLIK